MTAPSERRITLVIPEPKWRDALAALAKRNGVSVSAYICMRLMPLVAHELRQRDGDEPVGASDA